MESMGAAAAEGSKSTKSLERESMDAAAAHQRWRAFASRLQSLARIGRVVLRAKRAHARLPVVEAALADANSWVSGGAKASRAWHAHAAVDTAIARCAGASERNRLRAQRAAATIKQADSSRAPATLPRAKPWPPEVRYRNAAFADASWMTTDTDHLNVAEASDRVARVAGGEGARKTYELAQRLCQYADLRARALRQHVESTSLGARVALPRQFEEAACRGYALAFSRAYGASVDPLDANDRPHIGKTALMDEGGSRAPTLDAFLLEDGRLREKADGSLMRIHSRLDPHRAEIVHRLLLASQRAKRLEPLRRATAGWDGWWASSGDDADDAYRLRESYALYLGGAALPTFFVGDAVDVQHNFGKLIFTCTERCYGEFVGDLRVWVQEGDPVQQGDIEEEHHPSTCDGKVLAWTDALGANADVSRVEYLVEFSQRRVEITISERTRGLAAAKRVAAAVKDREIAALREVLAGATAEVGGLVVMMCAGFGWNEGLTAALAAGAPLLCQNSFGNTPMHQAARGGHATTLELLVALDASALRIRNSRKELPLHLAGFSRKQRALEVLLDAMNASGEAGATVDAVQEGGMTALHYVCERDSDGIVDCVRLLLERGADPRIRQNPKDATKPQGFTARGVDAAQRTKQQRTPAMCIPKQTETSALGAVTYSYSDRAAAAIRAMEARTKALDELNDVTALRERNDGTLTSLVEADPGEFGTEALRRCAEIGWAEGLRMAVKAGADLGCKMLSGAGVAHIAALGAHADALRTLVELEEEEADIARVVPGAKERKKTKKEEALADDIRNVRSKLRDFKKSLAASEKTIEDAQRDEKKKTVTVGRIRELKGIRDRERKKINSKLKPAIDKLESQAARLIAEAKQAAAKADALVARRRRRVVWEDAANGRAESAVGLPVRTNFGDGVAAAVDAGASTISLDWGATLKAPHAARSVSCPRAAALAVVRGQNQQGETPLHLAASHKTGVEAVALLLDAGVPLTATTADRSTVLHYACKGGSEACVSALLARDADPYAINSSGKLPGSCFPPGAEAAKAVLDANVRAREIAADAAARDLYDTSAVRGRDVAALRASLRRDPEKLGSLAVLMCAEMGWAEGLEAALGARAALGVGTSSFLGSSFIGPSTLVCKTASGNGPLHQAAQYGHGDVLETLLRLGDSVDALNRHNETPLHLAADNGFATIVARLADAGSKLDLTADGSTALHYACRRRHVACVGELLRRGAHLSTRNSMGATPVHDAMRRGGGGMMHCPPPPAPSRQTPAAAPKQSGMLSGLMGTMASIARGAVGADRDALGGSSSEQAAEPAAQSAAAAPAATDTCDARVEILRVILRHVPSAADTTDITDFKNNQPLHVAADAGCAGAIEMLLDAGANVDALNADNRTALHYACQSFDQDCVELLLERGATASIQDKKKQLPVFLLGLSDVPAQAKDTLNAATAASVALAEEEKKERKRREEELKHRSASGAPAVREFVPEADRVVAASLTEDRVIEREKTEQGLNPVLCRALVPEAALTIKNSDVSRRAMYAAVVSAAVAHDDASAALKTVCEAFAIPGFQGIHARDALKWLRTALKKERPKLVEVLLEVELIDDREEEEGGTADERKRRLRTNVVSGALKCAIREDNLLKKSREGLRCAEIVVDMEASRSCVRLTDLRCVLESMLAAEKSGAVFFAKPHELGSSSSVIPKSAIVDQLYNLFHGLLAAYDDGAALEAYALTGTKPLLSEVLDRSDTPAAMQTKVVVAIANRLAALGASLSVEDRPAPHGLSLAHVVVARGIEDTIKSLVLGGHVPSDDYGRTPLSLAIQLRRNASVVKAVAQGATVAHLEAVDAFGCTPLHHAARGGAAAVCKALLAELPPHLVDAKNLAGESALLVAATSSSPHRVAVCQLLLEKGATLDRGAAFQLLADPEHVKRPGWEAIEPELLQAPHDELPIHALVAADRVDAVHQRATVAAEAVVRAHHYARHVEAAGGRDLGLTALHLARSQAMAQLLLDADPDAWRRRTKSGDTPLHRACARDDAEVVAELLRRGAKWGRAFENRDGQTAYQLATGESKTLIKAAIAAREQERRRREEEALERRRATTDWLAVAEKVDTPDKLALIRDSVAKLSPPQSASDDEIDVPERVDGAAVPTRSSSPRPEGTDFAPELPVFLTPDALTQLFQMDGQSRRRAITLIEAIPADAAPAGAIRVDKSLEVYLSSDRSVVFEFAYDYVDGGRSHTRVLRVYSMDEREPEATKVLLTRIGKLHRAGRASPLAYKLSEEPGKGQKYYKLPDPISVTGVMKCYRLTRKLIDIATSGQFLEPSRGVRSDFELDHVEIEEVSRWSRDPTPTLLLGRGGTGKTLIILQSLWRKYQLAVEEGEGGVVVFVTGSNVLRNSVREAFISLRHAYHGIKPTDAPPASLRQKDLGVDDGRPRVLFYTTNELLAAIDASCARSLLSGDQRAESAATSLEESLRKHATAEVTTEATTEVTDAHFTRWWQRGLGRGVRADPGVVWSEILTHIKGSPRVSARGKPLSREEYLALPRKTAPAFAGLGSAGSEKWGSRDAVYDIYERYEQEKAKLVGAYDICDLVTSCMTQVVDGESYEGIRLSALICDEVQDFTLSTVVLLLNLLEDEDQFMCGGDTAQTICKVTFNFKDLGVVLNRRRDKASKRLEAHWAAAPADRGPIAPAVPRESQLRVLRTNYRCHQGVLSVANLCIEMMQLFPNSVDAIEPERAHFAGAAPLLFLDDDFNDVADVFSGGYTASDFGANQVIIVRDEAAKRALPAQLAGALAMTPLEAKGLEFDDVFAWNFFHDSAAPDRAWGAVAQEIGCPGDAAAAFDARTHLVLSDELKQLYVACTRARERLVFFDQSATARKAFFDALLHRRIGRAHDGVFSRTDGSVALARASEAREWRSRGTQFLKRAEDGDYERASECFSKSGDEPRRLLCIGLKTLSLARAADDRAKALTAAYLLARSECEGSEAPLAEALEACGEQGVAADAWRRLGRESDAFRASREHLRKTNPEAHAAWKADADAAARAALAAKQAAVRRARQAARKKARAPAEPVIGRPRAAPTETRSVARRLLDEKIKKAEAAAPRRTDASSEAAAPPSIATQTSKATSAATSAIPVAPSAHAQERMVEREIARRDLQEAKKYGARRSMPGGRQSYEFRGLKYIEAPGRSAVGVTAFYKSVPDGCCERAFVAYGGAKKPSRRDVDRLVQGILRDRGDEVHVSEHSERGEWGYLVAARSSEATDEVADRLRKLLSAGRAAQPATELAPVREDAAVEAPFPPPPAESIAVASFPPLPGSGQVAARLDALEAAQRESDEKYAMAQDELKRMAQTLATTKMQLERAQKARVESEAARDALREARDDLEVELATTTQRMNSALAAVAQRDKVIEERERELRELRAQLVAPQAVPCRSAEREVGSPSNEAPRGKKSRKAKTAPPRDIVAFLNKANLAKYRGIFEKEEITLDTLPDLDDETLAELGLSKKERQRFVAARASL